MSSQANEPTRAALPATGPAPAIRAQRLLAAGGLLGAAAAASCCLVPLLLFALGVSGAWIGNLTRLAPYHAYFIAAALGCVGGGYWLVRRSAARGCTAGGACARPLPNRFVRLGLVFSTAMIIAALAADFLAPLFY